MGKGIRGEEVGIRRINLRAVIQRDFRETLGGLAKVKSEPRPAPSKAVFSPRWSSKFSEFPWYQRFRKGFPRKVGVRRVDPYSGTDLGDKGESHAVGRSRGFHIDWKPYEKPDRGSSKEDSAGTEQRVHVGFDRLVNGDGTNRREDLGAKHNEKSTVLVGPSANLGGEKRCPCKSGYSCVVCDSDKGIEARNVGLRKGVLRHAEEDGIGERDIEAASGGAKGRRRCGAVGAGGTDKSFCFDCVGNEARCSAEDGLTDRMEIGGEMGGGMEAGEKKFRFHFCGGNNCGLVGCSEGTEGRSFQTIEMGSDKRLFDSRDSPGFAGSRGLCKSDKEFDRVGSNGLGAFGSCPIPDVNFLFIFFFLTGPEGDNDCC